MSLFCAENHKAKSLKQESKKTLFRFLAISRHTSEERRQPKISDHDVRLEIELSRHRSDSTDGKVFSPRLAKSAIAVVGRDYSDIVLLPDHYDPYFLD